MSFESVVERYWLSSNSMTVAVNVKDGVIVGSVPPIIRKFKGRDFYQLTNWMRKQGGFKMRKMWEKTES